MTHFKSTASGNWSNAAIWNEPGVPGPGDLVTIQDGHAIVVDGDATIGRPGHDGLVLSGKLTLAAGRTLAVIGEHDSTILLDPGAKYVYQNSIGAGTLVG